MNGFAGARSSGFKRALARIASMGAMFALLLPTASSQAWDEVAMCAMRPAEAPMEEGVSREAGERAMQEARRLLGEGREGEALLHLEVAVRAFPLVADRIAFLRGQTLFSLGETASACESFAEARRSADPALAIQADVHLVRCRIALDARTTEMELNQLRHRYPRLPEALRLRFELAQSFERQGRLSAAVAIYRELDLTQPGHVVGVSSRARLAELRESGHAIPSYTHLERLARLERMLRWGPEDLARSEIAALTDDPRVPPPIRARVRLLAADEEATARKLVDGAELDAQEADTEAVEAKVRRLAGPLPYRALPLLRLGHLVRVAAAAGARASVDEILAAMVEKNAAPHVLFHTALRTAGVASDDRIAELLERIVDHPELGLVARYHRARALERLGRHTDAEDEYRRVQELDSTETRYYAMWSSQRLGVVREERLARAANSSGDAPISLVTHWASPAGAVRSERPWTLPEEPDAKAVSALLEPLASELGEVFPSLVRAAALVRIEEFDAAADELHEVYLAWRDAIGRPLARVGLESVYRGNARSRQAVPAPILRARRELGIELREELARVAEALGDVGVAIGFRGWRSADERPRAYAGMVEAAARRHGLDPNLLFAVMRVESVYQRRILSHAGAIGLMQIMPSTGHRLAYLAGRENFTTAELLDPAINLDLAAFYLASLIRRFEGRLPLAIAAYNGGPQNVRKWLREAPAPMPLDVFLEHIPFRETHRYVRRVLMHYAAYRAQEGLPMERLSTALPPAVP